MQDNCLDMMICWHYSGLVRQDSERFFIESTSIFCQQGDEPYLDTEKIREGSLTALASTESSLAGLKSVPYLFAATEEVCWVNLSSQPNLNPPIEKVNIVNWKLSKSLT